MWYPLIWSSGCSDHEFGLSLWVFYFRRSSSAKDVFQNSRSWWTANRWQYFLLFSFVVCVFVCLFVCLCVCVCVCVCVCLCVTAPPPPHLPTLLYFVLLRRCQNGFRFLFPVKKHTLKKKAPRTGLIVINPFSISYVNDNIVIVLNIQQGFKGDNLILLL